MSRAIVAAAQVHLRTEASAGLLEAETAAMAGASLAMHQHMRPTGAAADDAAADGTATSSSGVPDTVDWATLLRTGLRNLDVLASADQPLAFDALLGPDGGGGGDGNDPTLPQRTRIADEFVRILAAAEDPLIRFLTLVAGFAGRSLAELLHVDPSDASRDEEARQMREDVSKRVADVQSKIVETIVAGMARASSLTLSASDERLVVVDAQARKELNELASGTTSKPFFASSVALAALVDREARLRIELVF